MICRKCGEVLEDGTEVCPKCGASQLETPVENTDAEQTAQTPAEEPVKETEHTAEAENTLEEKAEKAAPAADNQPQPPINGKKLAMIICAVILVVAVTVALIWAVTRPSDQETDPTDVVSTGETTQETQDGTAPQADATAPTLGEPTPEQIEENPILGRKTYTAEDTGLLEKSAITMENMTVSNREFSIWYWQTFYDLSNSLGYYAAMYGLDPNAPLDQQPCPMSDVPMTWEQFLLEQTILNWKSYAALTAEAEKAGMTLTEEEQKTLDTMEESLSSTAQQYGFASAEEMLRNDFGSTVTLDDYKAFIRTMMMGNHYYTHMQEKLMPSQEDVKKYYEENAEDLNQQGILQDGKPYSVSVRHILVSPEGDPAGEEGAYSKEQMDAARAEAQELLDAWKAGEATEESFAALATEKTDDPGSASNGGLYEDFTMGKMVKPFEDWSFDTARKQGDTELVETDFGIHVMYFVSASETENWYQKTQTQLLNELLQDGMEELTDKYQCDVNYQDLHLAALKKSVAE